MMNEGKAVRRFHSIKVSIGDSGSLDLSSILGGTKFFAPPNGFSLLSFR